MCVAFHVIHGGWGLSALDVGSADNLVVSAKFTLWMWVKETHVFEGATSDEQSSVSVSWTAFGLDGVNVKSEWLNSVFVLELCSDSLLLLGERQSGCPALWSVAIIGDWRGLIFVVCNYFSEYIVLRVQCGLTIALGGDYCEEK